MAKQTLKRNGSVVQLTNSTAGSTNHTVLQSTAGSTNPGLFPIGTQDKIIFRALYASSGVGQRGHFLIHSGDPDAGAWKSGEGDLKITYGTPSSAGHTYMFGPLESARFVCKATAANTRAGVSTGDPVVKIGFQTWADATAYDNPSTNAPVTGQAHVAVLNLPEVTFNT